MKLVGMVSFADGYSHNLFSLFDVCFGFATVQNYRGRQVQVAVA
jgi:hypothetical protein